MLARNYYNTVRKERLNKLKSKTIVALLRMLKENNFIYRTRVSVDENAADITRKLIQLFKYILSK
jgi:ribosomal protein S8